MESRSMTGFWSKHRRKIFIAMGTLGCGYALYRLYDSQKRRTIELERELFDARHQADELIRAQLRTHFENIQRISESTTLPHAMSYLRSRVAEELDISQLTEKLMQGKGQPNSLQPNEKIELWNQLKILSFTRLATSVWAMVVLFLYVRVQVNILGRQIYLETARGFASTSGQGEEGPLDRHGQQEFLATADYLSNFGFGSLVLHMENATTQILRDKQLTEAFSMARLSQTIMEILWLFTNGMAPGSWVNHIVPDNVAAYQKMMMMMSSVGVNNSNILMDATILEQLIAEARAVLLSPDFGNVLEITMRTVVDALMEDLGMELNNITPRYPLAKLCPRVSALVSAVLEDVNNNRYIRTIQRLPDVELFYTLLYTNISQ